ncbi:hypothetical protein D3C84_1245140 [compost metagenome]
MVIVRMEHDHPALAYAIERGRGRGLTPAVVIPAMADDHAAAGVGLQKGAHARECVFE